jgi:hypothetical protein
MGARVRSRVRSPTYACVARGAATGRNGWLAALVLEAGRLIALEELYLGYSALGPPVWHALAAAAAAGSYRRVAAAADARAGSPQT